MNAVKTAIREVAEFVGLGDLLEQVDAERVEKFKRAQAEAGKIPELSASLAECGAKLLAAREAAAKGQLYDGGDARFFVIELEQAYHGIGNRLATAKQAEVALVGLCPCRELQQRRRDLVEVRRATLKRTEELKQLRERKQRDVDREQEQLCGDIPKQDAVRIASRLRDLKDDLARIDDELTGLESDRQQLDVDLDKLKGEMKAFSV